MSTIYELVYHKELNMLTIFMVTWACFIIVGERLGVSLIGFIKKFTIYWFLISMPQARK